MTTQQAALPPGTKLQNGAFEILQVLGQGGFAITYLAREVRQDRLVAIKEFFPLDSNRQGNEVQFSSSLSQPEQTNAKQKFLSEARVLGQLHHPHIVEVYASFEEYNTVYLAMEFLEGKTLLEIVEEAKQSKRSHKGGLPEAEALTYVEQVAQALKAVHKEHYIHRDVKPENVMVCTDGRAVLLDFGLNKQLAGAANYGTMQLTVGLRFGSPGYSPPEQYGQQNRFGTYTDIYALGATLYYLLTGAVPEEAPERMYGGELAEVRRLNKQVSQPVNDAVMWALQLKGDARPQTVDDFLNALHAGQTAPTKDAALKHTGANGNVAAVPNDSAGSSRRPSQLSPMAPSQSSLPSPVPMRSASNPASAGGGVLIAKGKGALGHAVTRTGTHFKSGFKEILPRLLLIVAIILFLIFATRRQQEQSTSSGKKGAVPTAKVKSSG